MASIERAGTPTSPVHRISKVSQDMLTGVFASELAGTGTLVKADSPGYAKTDMSPQITRPVEDSADTPVWVAALPDAGPTGGFFHERLALEW